jgi:ribosome silencing factor RsfS/YbeB/iojap
VPLEKKPPRRKPQEKVDDGAASAPVSKPKHTAGAKPPPKPRAARAAGAAAKTARKGPKSSAPAPAAAAPGATPPAARGVHARGLQRRGVHTPAAALAALRSVVLGALDDMKALEVKVLDVRGLTDIADYMVIASGTSDRHVRSTAQRVVEKTKAAGYRPHGCEGLKDADWVLIDLHEMIVHIMLPRVREFYGLEKLWDMSAKRVARA